MDILEAMNPLFPLRPLAPNIKHAVGQLTKAEDTLSDSRRSKPRAEEVLVVWDVSVGPYAFHVLNKTCRWPLVSSH